MNIWLLFFIVLCFLASSDGKQQVLQPASSHHEVPTISVQDATLGKYAAPRVDTFDFDIVRSFRRRNDSFTQGLAAVVSTQGSNVSLFESAGLWGKSHVQVYSCIGACSSKGDPNSTLAAGCECVVTNRETLLPTFFGEGIAVFPESHFLWQLSYKSGVFLRHSIHLVAAEGGASQFQIKFIDTIPFPADAFEEGWGLTARVIHGPRAARIFYVTDGSEFVYALRVVEEDNLNTTQGPHVHLMQKLEVVDPHGNRIRRLNDIAWDEKRQSLWACVYGSTALLQISVPFVSTTRSEPHFATALVTGSVNLQDLAPATNVLGLNVMNGVAVDPISDTLWVTGKWWDTIYEIRVDCCHNTAAHADDVLTFPSRNGFW